MMNDQVIWAKAPDFAEVAEVVQVPTDRVLAARKGTDGDWWVLYTPHWDEDDHTLWSAMLKRNADGILVLDSVPRSHPGMAENLERELEKWLKENSDE